MGKKIQLKRAWAEDYDLLKDAYFGTGGFADGTYLVQHKRERQPNYDARRAIAYYLNYLASVVNSHVDPIFREPPSREWNGRGGKADLFGLFLDDMDTAGANADRFWKRAALVAKLYGVAVIVIDNVTAEDQPPTLAGVIEKRAFPYAYIVEPGRVVSYRVNRFGRLTEFSYREIADEVVDDTAFQQYNTRVWTEAGWKLYDSGGNLIGFGDHTLGRVPVVLLKSRPVAADVVLPPSEFGPIARTNLHLYQLSSWLAEIMQNQTFSILVYPSKDPANLVIGTNNALGYDGANAKSPPAFIAPPADPAKILADQIDRLIQDIHRMAKQTFSNGTKAANSADSKAWDFEKSNQALVDMADNCEGAEKEVAALFGQWIGRDVGFVCEYPRDFAILDIGEELDNAQKAIDLALGDRFLMEVAKKVIAAYLPNLEPEVVQEILDAMEQKSLDRQHSENGDFFGEGSGDGSGAGMSAADPAKLADAIKRCLAQMDPDQQAEFKAAALQVLKDAGQAGE